MYIINDDIYIYIYIYIYICVCWYVRNRMNMAKSVISKTKIIYEPK